MSDPTDIASRLEAAEQQVAETEARLPQAALRLALGNPEPGDDEVAPRLRELVAQRDMLRAAVEGAEIEERRIRDADKMRDRAAKIRSGQQKLGALDRHMHEAAAAARMMVEAFSKAAADARDLWALFPGSNGLSPITPSRLARLIQSQIEDAGREYRVRVFDGHSIPWTMDMERPRTGVIRPFDELLGIDGIKQRLKHLLSQNLPVSAMSADEAGAGDSVVSPPSPAPATPSDPNAEDAA